MNLREFSKKVGLPVSTISKALGGYKDVNIRTKNKIKTLAKKHNYSPNLHAKNLASRNILSVGFVLPTQDNFIHKLSLIEFIQNIHSELNKINIPVVMIFAKNKHDEIESYKKLINYHKVKLIILNDTKKNDERISFLDKYNMPYLTWGRTNKDKNSYTWIDEDVDYTTKIAIDYIISNGHKKICLISSMNETNYFHLRQKSFSNYCKKNNITFKKKQLLKLQADNFNLEKDKLIKFLKKNKETSLYLILSEQFLNIVLESFKETKKEIGRDVSIISFDSNLVDSLAPNITTISQPVNDVKTNLTQLIVNKLQNINSNKYYLYKSKLIKKKSVLNIVKKNVN